MKILIYLGHPAQYHFFKNIIQELSAHGHTLKILIKSKDILEKLVQEDRMIVENILPEGRGDSKASMISSMLKRDIRVFKIARKFKPDMLLGSDTSVSHIGRLISKPCLTVGEDDYTIIKKLAWLLMPFSTCILSPDSCDLGPFNYKKISYSGYMKLAYLHPGVFTPSSVGIENYTNTKYCIIRLAKLVAYHDSNVRGLCEEDILKIIDLLEARSFKIYIDSEYPLSEKIKPFQLDIHKNRMHDLMSFASLVITDSQSMTVESAMLGVPSIRFNDFVGKIGVLNELENVYKLTYGIKPSDPQSLFTKVDELSGIENIKDLFQQRRLKMLSEKINVTRFFVWLIENYPRSISIMKHNPGYQKKFIQNRSESSR